MLEVDIPGTVRLRLAHAVLDVNGTLALDGELLPGVAERIRDLAACLEVHVVTGNTFGTQDEVDRVLGLTATRLSDAPGQAEEKARFVRELGAERVVAIGNGVNDSLMLHSAALGIAVVGPEGAAGATIRAADVVVPDICSAFDLLLKPRRLVATLRS